MREREIGGISVSTSSPSQVKAPIIAVFAADTCGKTRLALSGPAPIGIAALESKSYPTIEKDGDDNGIEIIRPAKPELLLINQREISAYTDTGTGDKKIDRAAHQQIHFAKHLSKVEEYIYGLLEEEDIRLVCVDKFTTYCNWVKFAINGMAEKYVKVQGKVYIDNSEVNQHIIDFINSLGRYDKPVVLLCAAKPDYDGPKDSDGNPTRKTWDTGSFKYLGSHANLVVELQRNDLWDPEKNGDKYDWHYRLNVRRSQTRPELEGPDGQKILKDEDISLPKLMKKVLSKEQFDVEDWMP